MYLDRLKTEVEKQKLILPEQIIPCSKVEIDILEQDLRVHLPQAYKEFLLWAGKSAGPLLKGSDCFYTSLPHLKQWAIELLAENHFGEQLPEDALVFFMHQGYQFAFMRTSKDENPPVYYYNETQNLETFVLTHSSFVQFLDAHIARLAAHKSTTK